MEQNEWCVIVHVDIGTLSGLDAVEEQMRNLVDDGKESAGTIELSVARVLGRPNHFEVIGRYESEAAYLAHLITPSNQAFRRYIAPMLGVPYEDRLHGARGPQHWPHADVGDFVVITQLEARPASLDAALPLVDLLAESRDAAASMIGQVRLQRHHRPDNLELVSVWASQQAFDAYTESKEAKAAIAALEPLLLAPVIDRRNELIIGAWSAR